jgi:hypothetical protein
MIEDAPAASDHHVRATADPAGGSNQGTDPQAGFFERITSLVSISALPVRPIQKSWAQVDAERVIIEGEQEWLTTRA